MANKKYVEEIVITEDEPVVNPVVMHSTSISELNKVVVLPFQEYDCVIYSSNIPLDVAMSKAHYCLKVGGEFIVDKSVISLSEWMDVILSLFDVKDSNESTIVFIKAG